MEKLTLCLLLPFFLSISVFAQNKQGWNFVYSDSSGIHFSQISDSIKAGYLPTVTQNSHNKEPWGGGGFIGGGADIVSQQAIISDKNGELLFYSSAKVVWNAQHDTVQNGLLPYLENGIYTTTMLPHPKDPDSVFILFRAGYWNILDYTLIDSRLNEGKGGVVVDKKAFPITLDSMCYKMKAIKHGNGVDWWLLTRRINSADWYKWLITPDTIQLFKQTIGSMDSTNWFTGKSLGHLSFSRSGDTLVSPNLKTGLDLFYFNRWSGNLILLNTLPLCKQIDHPSFPDPNGKESYIGCEFSPNGRYLYCSVAGYSYVAQYDLQAPDFCASRVKLTPFYPQSNSNASFCSPLLGPDGKIYVSSVLASLDTTYFYKPLMGSLSIIHSPNEKGAACNFEQEGFYLNGKRNMGGGPNIPDYNLGYQDPNDTLVLTGRKEVKEQETGLQAYPNPTTGQITIRWTTATAARYTLTDAVGRTVWNATTDAQTETTVDFSAFPAGVYTLAAQTAKEQKHKRIALVK